MTGLDTFKATLVELASERTRSMTPEEFNYHYKVGELEWIRLHYDVYDEYQSAKERLEMIAVETDGVFGPSPLQPDTNGLFVFPSDFLHLLSVSVKVAFKNEPCHEDGTLSDWIRATDDKDSQMELGQADYYSRYAPFFPNLKYRQRKKRIQVFAGESQATLCKIAYLQRPIPASINPDGTSNTNPVWDDEEVYEIVKWTVASYLEKLESQRAQSLLALQNIVNQTSKTS